MAGTRPDPGGENWLPASIYPIDGTIILVEGRGRMRYRGYKASERDVLYHLGGWIIDNGEGWEPTPPPAGRWHKAPAVKV